MADGLLLVVPTQIYGKIVKTLIDSGATRCFVTPSYVARVALKGMPQDVFLELGNGQKLFAVMLEHGSWRARMHYKTALMTGRIGAARGVVVEEATQISVWGGPGEALWSEGHAICDLPAQVRLMRRPVKLIS